MKTTFNNFFEDKPPRKDFWLLFKVSSYERLLQMQKGLLYMNSLEFFSTLKDEEALALRVDKLEKVYGVLRAGRNDSGYSTLSIKIGDNEEISLGDEAIITATFPRPKNTMLFCMGAFSDNPNGLITGEKKDKLFFDEKFLEFGSHLLIINNSNEFSKRINAALQKSKGSFGSKLFHNGYGLVDYKSLDNHSGVKGLYTKDIKYSWQMEFRICFGVEDKYLNINGAYEFNIGDISDISQILPVQALLDEPLTIKRRTYKKTGDSYEQIK